MLVGVGLQVIQLANPVAVVDVQLPAAVAVHGGAGVVGQVDGVDVLAADEIAMGVRRGLAGQDGAQGAALHGVGHGQTGEFQQRGCDICQFNQRIASQVSLN